MTGRLEGRTAFITGAARGQGRAHAVTLAPHGARIIGVDICKDVDAVGYPMSSSDDLAETERLVTEAGGQILVLQADVRRQEELDAAVAAGLDRFGGIDIVCANAGLTTYNRTWELDDGEWDAIVGVNLTGVWRTVKATVPSMIAARRGGSIVITSSAGGRKGIPNAAHYVATKHGVVGLMRTLANEVARYDIRVNTVHPTAVDTALIHNDMTYRLFCPDIENPTREDAESRFMGGNSIRVPWVQPEDISNAIVWLCSDEATYVTGSEIPVDAGFHNKV